MKRKALFLDLDGTLLNDQKEITEGNRKAIEKALFLGHKVIIATGRPLVSAIKQGKALGLTGPGCYMISFNGGIIYDMAEEKIIYKQVIPMELTRRVFAEANKRGIHIQTYDDTHALVESRNDNDNIRFYCKSIKMDYKVIDDIMTHETEPVKMLMIDFASREKTSQMITWIRENCKGQLDAFFSTKAYVEIVPANLNKGNAVLWLSDYLHIPVEDTIAAGDAENDITMIEKAGLGVCMINGEDPVKAVADYITTNDNNHDGIAEVIEKFML